MSHGLNSKQENLQFNINIRSNSTLTSNISWDLFALTIKYQYQDITTDSLSFENGRQK